jgi:predicted nucleotidyltransferase
MAHKKRKKPKIHTDDRGHFVWENFFVRGKQKRRKQRVTVIDGEIIEDLDEWLLQNADDLTLHQMERWELIEQRRLEETASASPDTSAPKMRKLPLKIFDIESAFESLQMSDPDFPETPVCAFLNLTNGEIVWPEDDDKLHKFWADENLLRLPDDFDDFGVGGNFGNSAMATFVDSLDDGPVRDRLAGAIRGKGAFRRLKDIIFCGGDVALRDAWNWFQTRETREQIVAWLNANGIEPEWDCDIFEPPNRPDKRPDLLRAVLQFVRDARGVDGVRRIALLGSLTTAKAIPKDVDVLVEVADGAALDQLARRKRQLLGKAMQTGDSCGADVFLCAPDGRYLGRVCGWKQCAPGIRQSCQAQHCGQREHLCDDLQNVKLDAALIAEPPLELWPKVAARIELPADVREELVDPLAQDSA